MSYIHICLHIILYRETPIRHPVVGYYRIYTDTHTHTHTHTQSVCGPWLLLVMGVYNSLLESKRDSNCIVVH